MTPDDAKRLTKFLAGLFPNQLTQDQARYAADEFKAFDAAEVEKAIKVHRESHEFINWPQLFGTCRPLVEKPKPRPGEFVRAESFPDVIRRQWPDLQNASDMEVLLRYWRGDWWRYKADADRRRLQIPEGAPFEVARKVIDANEEGYRSRVLSGCVGSILAASGEEMTPENAERWAEWVFTEPGDFRLALDELRGVTRGVFAA